MPKDPINPFQSPQASPDEAPSVVSAVAEEEWPFEATELAVIEEIEPPLGRPIVPGWPWGKIIAILSLIIFGLFALKLVASFVMTWLAGNSVGLTAAMVQQIVFLLFIIVPALSLLLTVGRRFFIEDVAMQRQLARLIRQRGTTPIPSLNSPNCQFVAIVPRERWHLPENELTQEVAILHINPYESRIILEGAEHRFWIPSQALLKCGVDSFTITKNSIWVLCLIMQTQDGPREVCVRIGNVDGFWQSSSQQQSVAEKYWGRIMLLKKAPLKQAKET